MGRLLEDFVQRFSSPERALPNVRVATSYLYHHGPQRILRLLKNERLQTLRVLFSGKTEPNWWRLWGSAARSSSFCWTCSS